MKQVYVVANWKSNKTVEEAKSWMETMHGLLGSSRTGKRETIILCAPFTLLSTCRDSIARYSLPFSLGAQDVSPFSKGAYTGEVSAEMLKELVTYVLVGHSERRRYFLETDEELVFESLQAHESGLKVLYCVEHENSPVAGTADIVAYEPVSAIGTSAEDPKAAGRVCGTIKKISGKPVLYGGSVTAQNIGAYVTQPDIDGVLIGGASLDPHQFFSILATVQSCGEKTQ